MAREVTETGSVSKQGSKATWDPFTHNGQFPHKNCPWDNNVLEHSILTDIYSTSVYQTATISVCMPYIV